MRRNIIMLDSADYHQTFLCARGVVALQRTSLTSKDSHFASEFGIHFRIIYFLVIPPRIILLRAEFFSREKR
jgi:hypothetical protein